MVSPLRLKPSVVVAAPGSRRSGRPGIENAGNVMPPTVAPAVSTGVSRTRLSMAGAAGGGARALQRVDRWARVVDRREVSGVRGRQPVERRLRRIERGAEIQAVEAGLPGFAIGIGARAQRLRGRNGRQPARVQ